MPPRSTALHGTLACYKNGCRQPECRQANRDYVAAARARAKQQQPAIDPDLLSDDWVVVERALARQRRRNQPRPVAWWHRYAAKGTFGPMYTITLAEHRARNTTPIHHVQPRETAA